MILAQLTPNQIPYDAIDWLQIAIYFLALPIVAFLGAAIGLFGRWRHGGLLWSTNVGLLGGTVAFYVFAIAIWLVMRESSSSAHLMLFMDRFRSAMLWWTLLGTGGCACAAAIGWRLGKSPLPKQPLSFSLRQLLLLQFFSLLCIGGYLSLRHFMLDSIGHQELMLRSLAAQGWRYELRDKSIALDDYPPKLSYEELTKALEPQTLSQVAGIVGVEVVGMRLPNRTDVNLTPFLHHPTIRYLGFTCSGQSNKLLDDLAGSHVNRLFLEEDLRSLDFSHLAPSKSLKELIIGSSTVKQSSLESLSECHTIKTLTLHSVNIVRDGAPIDKWPPNLQTLAIYRTNFDAKELEPLADYRGLKELRLSDTLFDDAALKPFAKFQSLEKAAIAVGPVTDATFEILKSLREVTLRLSVYSPSLSAEQILQLGQLKKLELLDLGYVEHTDEVLAALGELKSLQILELASPQISENAALELASLPALKELHYPNHFDASAFERKFSARRVQLGFDDTRLAPLNQIAATSPAAPKPARIMAARKAKNQSSSEQARETDE
jgi:hypothetical protein